MLTLSGNPNTFHRKLTSTDAPGASVPRLWLKRLVPLADPSFSESVTGPLVAAPSFTTCTVTTTRLEFIGDQFMDWTAKPGLTRSRRTTLFERDTSGTVWSGSTTAKTVNGTPESGTKNVKATSFVPWGTSAFVSVILPISLLAWIAY